MSITIVGAGLSGSEAALTLAHAGFTVDLFEQKPKFFSAAHKLAGACELVCSNSLKSTETSSGHGLLKEELRRLGSPVLDFAAEARIPGGKALTVDRERLSQLVTTALEGHPKIRFHRESVEKIPQAEQVLIATGPLTSKSLSDDLQSFFGEEPLYFYDATSPVVTLESLDQSKFFWGSRNQDSDDYLNLPLTKEEYERFWNEIMNAEKVESHHPEEDLKFFEGCLPVEEIARRGIQNLSCSCMNPSGFGDRVGKDIYGVIQFRRERAAADLLSMVGFQTRMKWPEQERVFRSLPGMQNAEFVRLGAMHRNTFLNAPLHLTHRLESKRKHGLYFAGQITGSEGYSEALATGHYAALMIMGLPLPPETTALRSLVRFLIDSDPKHFQPMNFNFGLMPPLSVEEEKRSRGKIKMSRKSARNLVRSERALHALDAWANTHQDQLKLKSILGSPSSFALAH